MNADIFFIKDKIIFAVCNSAASYITAEVLDVNGGFLID